MRPAAPWGRPRSHSYSPEYNIEMKPATLVLRTRVAGFISILYSGLYECELGLPHGAAGRISPRHAFIISRIELCRQCGRRLTYKILLNFYCYSGPLTCVVRLHDLVYLYG